MTLIPITEKTQICFVHCGKEICKCNPSKQINKMKTHEITTSKGEFVVVDVPLEMVKYKDDNERKWLTYLLQKYYDLPLCVESMFFISKTTEEDACSIVDENKYGLFKNYECKYVVSGNEYKELSPLDSLHSLLKSKGIDVNNGNWYIFKKI